MIRLKCSASLLYVLEDIIIASLLDNAMIMLSTTFNLYLCWNSYKLAEEEVLVLY